MAERTATIAAPEGLHARPATLFVEAAKATGLKVTIAKEGGKPVSATSILSLMGLGAKHGDVVTLSAEGDGAEEKLDGLVAQLETAEH